MVFSLSAVLKGRRMDFTLSAVCPKGQPHEFYPLGCAPKGRPLIFSLSAGQPKAAVWILASRLCPKGPPSGF
jgi:hypothetical protein